MNRCDLVYDEKQKNKQFLYFCFILLIFEIAFAYINRMIFLFTGQNMYRYFDLYGFLYFCVDYSNGIVSRGLTGETMRLLFSNTTDVIFWFTIWRQFLSGCLFIGGLFILYKMIKKSSFDVSLALLIMAVRPLYLCSDIYMARPDHFWYIGMPVIFFLLWKDTNINYKMLFVILISTVCMLYHHAFLFVFAPVICLFLLEKKEYKWFFIFGSILSIEFIVLTCFCKGDYAYICKHMEDMIHQYKLWDRYGDYIYNDNAINSLSMEYSESRLTQMFENDGLLSEYPKHVILLGTNMLAGGISFGMSLNIINKWAKSLHKVNLLFAIIILPIFMLLFFTIDCDRWFLMYLTAYSVFATYLLHKNTVKVVLPKYMKLIYFITICLQFIRWIYWAYLGYI